MENENSVISKVDVRIIVSGLDIAEVVSKSLAKVTKKANDEGIDTVEHLLTADALRDMKFIINQAHADLVVIHALGSDDKRFVSFEENEVSQNQIGSVSERLLRTSDVPVVLVR